MDYECSSYARFVSAPEARNRQADQGGQRLKITERIGEIIEKEDDMWLPGEWMGDYFLSADS